VRIAKLYLVRGGVPRITIDQMGGNGSFLGKQPTVHEILGAKL
jgi:hypothetical protein